MCPFLLLLHPAVSVLRRKKKKKTHLCFSNFHRCPAPVVISVWYFSLAFWGLSFHKMHTLKRGGGGTTALETVGKRGDFILSALFWGHSEEKKTQEPTLPTSQQNTIRSVSWWSSPCFRDYIYKSIFTCRNFGSTKDNMRFPIGSHAE